MTSQSTTKQFSLWNIGLGIIIGFIIGYTVPKSTKYETKYVYTLNRSTTNNNKLPQDNDDGGKWFLKDGKFIDLYDVMRNQQNNVSSEGIGTVSRRSTNQDDMVSYKHNEIDKRRRRQQQQQQYHDPLIQRF
jgi:hypothetical protein